MNDDTPRKPYDPEDRTFEFARSCRQFVRQLVKTVVNIDDVKQLLRASGSIGANYIEANECLGKKDFVMKVKTCRREAKETVYWLRLLESDAHLERRHHELLREAGELMKIFGAIVRKSGGNLRFADSNFEFRI